MKVVLGLAPRLLFYFLLCFHAVFGGGRSSSHPEAVSHPPSKQGGTVGYHA